MLNFNIGYQIQKEIEEFRTKRIRLASVIENDGSVRNLRKNKGGYDFNQAEVIQLVDLYWNSRFADKETDKLGQSKIFLNVGKFRSQVASKQIDLDSKNAVFFPEDFADPYSAIFMQRDFKEWSKGAKFADIINIWVDKFPHYGTIVGKKIGSGNSKKIVDVPLQNLVVEQGAESLLTAAYVIELHEDMRLWEMQKMKNWNLDGLDLPFDEGMTVHERYGYVPLAWIKKANNESFEKEEWNEYVDAVVIVGIRKDRKSMKDGTHIFYAAQLSERPYREKHYDRQHGRWLGIGVIEDLFPNQNAKNIVVNLIRRSLHWSSRRNFQSANSTVSGKNLIRETEDGEVLEVGANGQITEIPMAAKTNQDFISFLTEFEKNSDQKAFTYEVITGESLPSGTPFRLGVVMSNAAQGFFQKKQEMLGLFLKEVIIDFLIPEFLRDMGSAERTISLFSGENGFEVLKKAAMDYIKSEMAHASILSGRPVDLAILEQAIEPVAALQSLFFKLPAKYYQDAKVKFDLTFTGEEIDLPAKIETLSNLYQALAARNDPRSEAVLERIASLSGESMERFGPKPIAQKPTLDVKEPAGITA